MPNTIERALETGRTVLHQGRTLASWEIREDGGWIYETVLLPHHLFAIRLRFSPEGVLEEIGRAIKTKAEKIGGSVQDVAVCIWHDPLQAAKNALRTTAATGIAATSLLSPPMNIQFPNTQFQLNGRNHPYQLFLSTYDGRGYLLPLHTPPDAPPYQSGSGMCTTQDDVAIAETEMGPLLLFGNPVPADTCVTPAGDNWNWKWGVPYMFVSYEYNGKEYTGWISLEDISIEGVSRDAITSEAREEIEHLLDIGDFPGALDQAIWLAQHVGDDEVVNRVHAEINRESATRIAREKKQNASKPKPVHTQTPIPRSAAKPLSTPSPDNNQRQSYGSGNVSGHVFVDVDGDSHRDPEEPLVYGENVVLTNGQTIYTSGINPEGLYAFAGIPPGTYRIIFHDGSEFSVTVEPDGELTIDSPQLPPPESPTPVSPYKSDVEPTNDDAFVETPTPFPTPTDVYTATPTASPQPTVFPPPTSGNAHSSPANHKENTPTTGDDASENQLIKIGISMALIGTVIACGYALRQFQRNYQTPRPRKKLQRR